MIPHRAVTVQPTNGERLGAWARNALAACFGALALWILSDIRDELRSVRADLHADRARIVALETWREITTQHVGADVLAGEPD